MKVSEVMVTPLLIGPLNHATKARAIMRREGVRLLIVVDDKNRMKGILKRGDLINITFTRTSAKVRDIMVPPRSIAYPDEDALSVVRRMLQAGEWYTIVVDRNEPSKVLGIMGLEHVIASLIEKNSAPLQIPVSEVMTRNPISCNLNDSVLEAWHEMQGHNFAGLPVVDNHGRVVGMITQYDILASGVGQLEVGTPSGRYKTPPKVCKIMKSPAITVKEDEPLLKAAQIMVERDFGRIPVIDQSGLLVGIVDREDVIRRYLP